LNAIRHRFQDTVDFAAIYIAEAHPVDFWPLGNHVSVTQPKTLEERLENARGFVDETGFEVPLFIDGIEDEHIAAFHCHPERFFVLSGEGKMLMKGQPVEGGYNLVELERFLETGLPPECP